MSTTPTNSNSQANLNPGNRKGKVGPRRKVTKNIVEFLDKFIQDNQAEFKLRMAGLDDVEWIKAMRDLMKFVGAKHVLEAMSAEANAANGKQDYKFTVVVHPNPRDAERLDAGTSATEIVEITTAAPTATGGYKPDFTKFLTQNNSDSE